MLRVTLVLALALSGCPAGEAAGDDGGPTLAAAASLRHVVPALVAAYRAAHGGPPLTVTYGSSGSLQNQVEGGAPVDGVLFAAAAPVDSLIEQGLAEATSRRVLATNALLLVGREALPGVTFETVTRLPPDASLCIGDPGSVPAGRYARQAFEALGSWKALGPRLVFGGDVANVLAYARRGEAAAAVVYATDLHGIEDVQILDRAEGPWAPRPQVVAAVTGRGGHAQQAGAFLDFVASAAGQAVLAEHGFLPPTK